ncbi:polymer-forming cytoskeletal protein [bacterium]|nr:polymer-forming cytoskeletal protein [bacterium]
MFNKRQDMNEQSNPTGPSTPAAPPLPQSNPSASAASHAGGASTLLADGCSFEGKAEVAGTLRIEGVADGEIHASDSVVIGKSGKVDAQVHTRRAVLNGRFRGKIEAEDCVEMQSGSNVEAEIHARNMVMEDGVQFEGNCKIGK